MYGLRISATDTGPRWLGTTIAEENKNSPVATVTIGAHGQGGGNRPAGGQVIGAGIHGPCATRGQDRAARDHRDADTARATHGSHTHGTAHIDRPARPKCWIRRPLHETLAPLAHAEFKVEPDSTGLVCWMAARRGTSTPGYTRRALPEPATYLQQLL